MKKYCKALVNIAVAVVLLLLAIFLLPRLLVFFLPFVIGWIISMIASPLVRFFEEKLKFKRKAGSAFVIIVVIGLVVTVIYLICSNVADQIMGLINDLPSMWKSMEADFMDIGKRMSVFYEKLPLNVQESFTVIIEEAGAYIGDLFGHISSPTIAVVGNIAKRVPSVLIGIIMCLLSSYFFVAERNQINDWFHRNAPGFLVERFSMIKRSLLKSVGGYFKAQLKIEVWMYLLLVIGLSILKVDYVLLIAFAIAILDLLPFFGTGTVMVPWAIIKILSGDYTVAIGLLIIWGVGQLARQIIQPKIVGDSVGVAPIPTLFLLFIGYKLSGVIGMILAVPLGLLLYSMYEEGAFDTTKNSVLILIAGINRFRRLKPQDLEAVEEMKADESARKAKMDR
ncbi:MAG: sporulation integral membrane protein YtvI [Lachnospiraceae bacterium]|nr:sporulation integral membrane protein YtvI [Lachnospiraceae bacterium]